ncbi:acyl carrier protein [Staphylococcus saccharolyticus]|uniref:Non-ribosomal peptide synthetase n=1 Tax=Staphylococcus saccharolyticus TaxID=33028 RepID=A0A380GYZ1_9STAP|nr:acyl carrier protein [Staphylococcus saccharolyticus]SUM67017.1 non-ribosomal peptide synthetase [Staphylococcus saccharolyticus]
MMFEFFVEILCHTSIDQSYLYKEIDINDNKRDLYFEAVKSIDEAEEINKYEVTIHEINSIFADIFSGTVPSHSSKFFEAGGDSFKAITLSNQIRERFGVEIELAYIFTNPTLSELVSKIEEIKITNGSEGVV